MDSCESLLLSPMIPMIHPEGQPTRAANQSLIVAKMRVNFAASFTGEMPTIRRPPDSRKCSPKNDGHNREDCARSKETEMGEGSVRGQYRGFRHLELGLGQCANDI